MNVSTSTSITTGSNNGTIAVNNQSSSRRGGIQTFIRLAFLLLTVFVVNANSFGQSLANYSFAYSNTASLTDMTSGTTVLSGLETGTYRDSYASAVTAMPIPFIYMGVLQTQFSCNSNGQLRFGSTAVSTTSITAPASGISYLAPIAGDNSIAASGQVHYKVTGSSPSRVMTIAWDSILVPYNNSSPAGVCQVRLYEGTGKIEYVYGRVFNTQTASQSRSIFLCSSNTATTNGYVTVGAVPTFTLATSNVTNTFAAGPLDVANLSSFADGSRWMYSWTPPAGNTMADPSSLNFTGVTTTGMTLNWTAASPTTGILGYAVLVSADGGVTYSLVGNTAVGTNTLAVTGLNPNTTYLWSVYSYNEGALSQNPATGVQSTNACTISGTKTVGPAPSNYLTLTAAIADIANNGITGPVVLELKSTYTSGSETFPITLSSVPCASSGNTITIRPAAGATGLLITSANTTATMDINGGSYYIIDGRPGGTGSTQDLQITNTSAATGGTAIRIINEAHDNTVKYCKMSAAYGSTTSGIMNIMGSAVPVNGNRYNIIDRNIFDGQAGATASPTTGVYNAIYSAGSTATGANNSGNVISNNEFKDIFRTGATLTINGISISTGNEGWTISGNSFYQTATRTATVGASTYNGILIATPGGPGNYQITGNYIGGSGPLATGTWTMTGAFANRFQGLNLVTSTTVGATPSTVSNNVITNMNWSSSSGATTLPGVWAGININSTCGSLSVSGNTIGATTGTGAVVVTISTTGGLSVGIGTASTATANISITNNNIGAITVAGSSASVSHSFTGIFNSAALAGSLTISGNTIGSTSTAGSIQYSTAGTGTTGAILSGIFNSAAPTQVVGIYQNTIANFTNAYVPAAAYTTNSVMRGIWTSSGIDSIAGNTVRDFSTAGNVTGSGSTASIIGIGNFSSTAGANYIRNNTVYSLANTNSGAAVHVTGIYYNGPTTGGTIDRNLVYSLTSPSAVAFVNGIVAGGQTATYQNNMVRLGIDATGASTITATNYNGFLETAGTNTIIHNTIYIGGTGVNTSPAINTYAFYNNALLTTTRVIRNNIFINERTSASTGGKHYAIRIGGTTVNPTGLTINNNIYRATGANQGILGFYNSADVASLAAWQGAVGGDAASLTGDPCLNNPTAGTPNLHLTDCSGAGSPADGAGVDLGVTNDYDNDVRVNLTPVDIGADAGNYGVVGVDVGITALVTPAVVTSCLTATETVTVTLRNFGVNTIDFSVNPVTITVTAPGYSDTKVISSGTLASNATQNEVMPATINMTTSGTYAFVSTATVTGDVQNGNNSNTTNRTVNALGGTYTVGTAGNYATLTAAVNAYNTANCFTAPVVFSLTDATYSTNETFPIVINANAAAGANTLTIRPAAGTAVTITGTSGATASALIKLNGADRIIIDGINTGGASLTIENTSATTGTATIWLASTGAGAGATNNTIQNTNIKAGIAQNASALVTYGIVMAGGTLSATLTSVTAGDDNDNNTFTGNNFTKVRYGIYTRGGATTNANTGTVITNNIFGPTAFGADQIGKGAVLIREEDGVNISGNTIRFVGGDYANTTGGSDRAGIAMGTDVTWTATSVFVKNATITRNLIHDVRDERTFSAAGIIIAGADGANATNNTIANNMISNISSNGTASDQTLGIGIGAGNGDKVVFNSISLTGDTDPNASATTPSVSSFGISVTAATNLDLRNNIVHMDLSSSSAPTLKHAAINIPAAYAWGTGGSNYNNLEVLVSNTQSNVGCVGGSGGTFYATLANWQTAVSQDANSTSVLPVFTSATDLHLVTTSNPLLDDTGTPVAGITGDYDNDTRDVTTPDMGADEFSAPVGLDISAIALVSPGTSGCYGTTESVTVRIKNFSPVLTHDLSTDNVTVTVTATGGYSSNIVLSTGTIAPLATMDVVLPATIDMSVNGAYAFDASAVITTGGPDLNLNNDTLSTVTRTGVPVSVGTVSASKRSYCITPGRPKMTLSSAAGGTIQWQVSNDHTNWTNVGTDSLQYTPAIDLTADTTYFKAIVTCAASSSSVTSNVDTVVYNNPSITGTTPNSRCGTGTVNLGATGSAGSTLNWYTAATGGSPIGTGTSFTTPSISSTTTYYVGASSGGGGSASVGAPNNGASGTYTLDAGLNFDVLASGGITLTGVYIYPVGTGAGVVNIELLNSSNTVIQTLAFNCVGTTAPGIKTFVPLGWVIPNGTGYYIGMESRTGLVASLVRDGTADIVGGAFALPNPYMTLPGVVSITSGRLTRTPASTSTSYYYFYDWVVSTGCESPRTAVTASVTAAPTISPSASPTSICLGQSTNLTVTSSYDPNYNYSWSPATTPASGASVSASPAATQLYTVTATDNLGTGLYAGCATTATVNVTVNPVPENVVMNPTSAQVCAGGNVTLNATSGTSVSGTITGGSITSISGNTGNPYRSGYTTNSRAKNQILILASELTGLGFTAGNITSIGFKATTVAATTELYDFTIAMANTSASALTTTMESSIGTTVYTYPGTFFAPVLGVNTHTFQTPFYWDGTSNVLVTVCTRLQSVSTTTAVETFTVASQNTQQVGATVTDCNVVVTTSTAASKPTMVIAGNTAAPITWSPSTYLNTNLGNTVISTPLTSPITYTATATLGSCTKTNTVTVTLSDLAISSAVETPASCNGQSTGAITVTATGGAGSYQYSTDGTTYQGSNVLGSLAAGTYTVYVKDANNCVVSQAGVIITEPAALNTGITASTDPTCHSTSPSPLNSDGSVTAAATGGTSPYTYVINGPTVNATGLNSGVFTGLTAGSYTVTATDFNGCQHTSTAVVLNDPAAPAVSAANNGPVCAGTNASLTATPGTYASYSWTGPGTINNASTASAEAVTPSDQDIFTVTITDNLGCTNTASTTVSVTTLSPVSVSLGVSPGTEVCSGSTITFTATPTNGGGSPVYEFFVNNVSVQSGSSDQYITTTLNDQDVVTVELTSSITCTSGNPATSNAITMTVSGVVTSDVTLSVSPTGTVCAGTLVTYTANPVAGGPQPTYEFFVNNVSVQGPGTPGNSLDTYTYAPANGDQVWVVMTSSFDCALINNPATSPIITASVNPVPSAPTISAGGAVTFCDGGSVVLTSDSSGAGNQWYQDGNIMPGETNPTLTVTVSGSYTVEYTENGCTSLASNAIVVTVNANPTAIITGTAAFCTGGNTTLSAASSSAGSGTITGYQWVLDGSTNLGTGETEVVNQAGSYTVIVTNSNGCSDTSAATVVTQSTSPTAAATASCLVITPGQTTTLDASASTAGSGTITNYQWVLNGSTNVGTNSVTYATTVAGSYTVIVTNSNGCSATSAPVVVAALTGPLAGGSSYTIPGAGCGEFTTLAGAVAYLNANGVTGTGTVTFNVAAGYTETAPGSGIGLNMCALGAGLQPNATLGITIQKSGAGANPVIMAGTGSGTTDYIFALIGADYVTINGIDLQANPANTTAVQKAEIGYALLKCSGTDGAQYNTIENCTVTLDKSNANTSVGIYGASADAALAAVVTTATSGANSYNILRNNTVSNSYIGIQLSGYSDVTPFAYYDQNNEIGQTGAGNSISNIGGGSAFVAGISTGNQNNLKVVGNTVNSGANAGTGTMQGISIGFASNANTDIIGNTVTITPSAATTGQNIALINTSGTRFGRPASASVNNTVNILNNIIQNSSYPATGTNDLWLLYHGKSGADSLSAANVNITGNQLLNNTQASTTSGRTMYGIINQVIIDNSVISNNTISGNAITGNVANNLRTIVTGMGGATTGTVPYAQNISVTGNTITGNTSVATTGSVDGIAVETYTGSSPQAGATVTISNNNVGNATYAAHTTGAYTGITTSVTTNVALVMNGNTVTNVTRNAATTGAFNGIRATGTALVSNTMNNNTVSNISMTGGTSATFSGITHAGSASVTTGLTMNGNTVSGCTVNGTGTMTCLDAGNAVTYQVNNNTVQNNTKTTASSGIFNGIISTGSTTTTTSMVFDGNTVSGNSMQGTSDMTLLNTASAVNITSTNNVVNGNSKSGASGAMYCTRAGGSSTTTITYSSNQVYNNSYTNTSGTTAANLYGYYNFATTGVAENYLNNQVYNLTMSGTNTATTSRLVGLYTGTSSTSVRTISGNLVYGLASNVTGTGAVIVAGIVHDYGAAASKVYKNKIYDLTSSNSGTTNGIVNGIGLGLFSPSSVGNATVYNNMIGDLKAPNSASTDAVRGISILETASSTSYNVYFNTIYLNASSIGANFGTSGIYHTASATATTAALDLRNNIVYNASTPAGTGRTVAYRRSSTSLTNFVSTSNNNLYYVTGAANTHVFSDGTNHLDLAGYTAFAGISPRETNSKTENVAFVSTTGSNATFLHINAVTPTWIEGGAVNIAGITDDFDSDIRQGNPGYLGVSLVGPDIGADELDATPPPCAGAVGGTATAAAFSCTSNTATVMTVTGATTGSGITYQWEVSATGGGVGFTPVTGGSGANSLSYTTATGLATGTYYYRLNVTCSNGPVTGYSNEITVQVRPTPTASASNNGPLCSGSTLNLTGTTDIGTTFGWTGPNGYTSTSQNPSFAAPINGSGNYIFTATLNGCSSSGTTAVTITNTPPPFSVNPPLSVVCAGSSVNLTAGGVSGTTEFGTGTTSIAGNTGYPYRAGSTLNSINKVQTLILASEITAAGYTAGNITALAGTILSVASPTYVTNRTIRMANTNVSVLTTTCETNLGTLVFSDPNQFDITVGQVVHPFSTPFYWDGVSNILITFCSQQPSNALVTVGMEGTTTATVLNTQPTPTTSVDCITTTTTLTTTTRVNYSLTFDLTPSNVTWTQSPALPATLDTYSGPNVVATPTTTTTYTATSTNGACTSQASAQVVINPEPLGTISGTVAVCQDAAQPVVTFTATSGTGPYVFSYNINGGTTLTATTGSGTNPLSVTVPVPTGTAGTFIYNLTGLTDIYCSNANVSGSATITVNALPVVSFTGLAAAYCVDAAAVTITGSQAPSGSFSGAGITDNADGTASFNPATAGVGSHAITYSYTDGNGCTGTSVQNVTVNALPTVSFTGLPATTCLNSGIITLTGNHAPGGTFTGTGITDNADGTASFNPVTAGIGGPYSITYSYTDGNGCSNSSSQTVTVSKILDWANLQWPPSGTVCAGGSLTAYGQVYEAGLTDPAGQAAGITVELGYNTSNTDPATWTNWQAATFNVQVGNNDEYMSTLTLPAGTYYYTFRYSLNGCAYQYGGYSAGGGGFWDGTSYVSGVLTVNAAPTVSFSGLAASYCINAGAVTITGNHAPSGSFSGTGITDNNDGTASFNPATAGVGGPYTISYSYTDGNGCSATYTQNVTVNALPTVSFTTLAATYCSTDAAVALTANHAGGTFTGAGITDNGNGTATFDPATAGVGGPYTITYSYTDGNGCSNSTTQQVSVVTCATFTTLNLTAFLEGFYDDINHMRANIYDIGVSTDPTETDTLLVGLWAPANLTNPSPDYSMQTIVHTDGVCTPMQFPAAVAGNSFYIQVKHRNHIETWSANAVAFTTNTSYNFTTSQAQAFDDGFDANPPMAPVAGGKFAFYGGDVNQDGGVDGFDASALEIDVNAFAFGYNASDANGDGSSDGFDASVIEINANLFIFFSHP